MWKQILDGNGWDIYIHTKHELMERGLKGPVELVRALVEDSALHTVRNRKTFEGVRGKLRTQLELVLEGLIPHWKTGNQPVFEWMLPVVENWLLAKIRDDHQTLLEDPELRKVAIQLWETLRLEDSANPQECRWFPPAEKMGAENCLRQLEAELATGCPQKALFPVSDLQGGGAVVEVTATVVPSKEPTQLSILPWSRLYYPPDKIAPKGYSLLGVLADRTEPHSQEYQTCLPEWLRNCRILIEFSDPLAKGGPGDRLVPLFITGDSLGLALWLAMYASAHRCPLRPNLIASVAVRRVGDELRLGAVEELKAKVEGIEQFSQLPASQRREFVCLFHPKNLKNEPVSSLSEKIPRICVNRLPDDDYHDYVSLFLDHSLAHPRFKRISRLDSLYDLKPFANLASQDQTNLKPISLNAVSQSLPKCVCHRCTPQKRTPFVTTAFEDDARVLAQTVVGMIQNGSSPRSCNNSLPIPLPLDMTLYHQQLSRAGNGLLAICQGITDTLAYWQAISQEMRHTETMLVNDVNGLLEHCLGQVWLILYKGGTEPQPELLNSLRTLKSALPAAWMMLISSGIRHIELPERCRQGGVWTIS